MKNDLTWKDSVHKIYLQEDDKNYLISYLRSDGTYSAPHRAYWVREEEKFFSLENNNSHPLIADIWTEIPELP